MQFEDYDKKIREAAENHHPAYDENAWAGMEKLLDKHLPQKDDDRRRIIFLLFLFLLLGGGSIWLFSAKPWKGNKQVTTAKNTSPKPSGKIPAIVSSNAENTSGNKKTTIHEDVSGVSVPDNFQTKTTTTSPNQIVSERNIFNNKDRQDIIYSIQGPAKKKRKANELVISPVKDREPVDKNLKKEPLGKNQDDVVTTSTTTASIFVPDQKNKTNDGTVIHDKVTTTKPGVNDQQDKEKTSKDNTPDKSNKLLVQSPQEKKEKNKTKKRNAFFFTISAGSDLSFTGNDKIGKTKLLAGGGLGYTFKDRLTIRSGFYSGRKIYTSSPGSYHPPADFWTYYPNLEKIDADCKVYEIPLSLSYNFGQPSEQGFFVSTGLSSYLMKKETYNYYYKYTPSGPTIQKKWTILDENKHYFSVLTLSGGYQKNIGKSVSIMIEPYFKVPLSGVGFGKVKLNSGGVLFSIAVKPFNINK
jgi:hypothetical protein